MSSIPINIPHEKVRCTCAQTSSGFVITDSENKTVYFTDAEGHIMRASSECVSPTGAVQTLWGHVLIVDYDDTVGNGVKAFSEVGDLLGNINDESDSIVNPQYVHVDEAARLLYIACGGIGEFEIRKYKFAPSDLQTLPVKRAVTTLEMDIQLTKI